MGRTRRQKLAPLLGALLSAAVLYAARPAHAQCAPGTLVCIGPDGRVIVQTPTVTTPPVHAGGQVGGQIDARAAAEARAKAEWEAAERLRLASWRLYFQWEA